MQDALMALQTDLASRIAIRYAGRLEKLVRFNMQAIHVPDMDEKGHSPGSGWVHQTWENVIVQQAREDIAGLLRKELFYYSIGEPKIVQGERDRVILAEMNQKQYDFFIEGVLHSFEPDRFFQKLDSDLYRNILCPVLMVKNLMDLNRGIQILGTPDTVSSVISWFLKLWSELPAEPDILVCQFEPSMEKHVFIENDNDLISIIEARFIKYGKKPATVKIVKGSSNSLVSLVRDHALLVSPLPTSSSQIAQMLAMSPCPILFCPEFSALLHKSCHKK
jgi:hypothetical protein